MTLTRPLSCLDFRSMVLALLAAKQAGTSLDASPLIHYRYHLATCSWCHARSNPLHEEALPWSENLSKLPLALTKLGVSSAEAFLATNPGCSERRLDLLLEATTSKDAREVLDSAHLLPLLEATSNAAIDDVTRKARKHDPMCASWLSALLRGLGSEASAEPERLRLRVLAGFQHHERARALEVWSTITRRGHHRSRVAGAAPQRGFSARCLASRVRLGSNTSLPWDAASLAGYQAFDLRTRKPSSALERTEAGLRVVAGSLEPGSWSVICLAPIDSATELLDTSAEERSLLFLCPCEGAEPPALVDALERGYWLEAWQLLSPQGRFGEIFLTLSSQLGLLDEANSQTGQVHEDFAFIVGGAGASDVAEAQNELARTLQALKEEHPPDDWLEG